ncbi:PadR family transcriptional regulator [Natrinema caseinilyticum]|uniref:PadR family transcriptional regulator n=1 Tax=Natrinema caseinilyticum TaxID=2961570 RepID=UPI0020C32C74|nr:PadR family transcriptional regulator [Natrinema caseinilyticum]
MQDDNSRGLESPDRSDASLEYDHHLSVAIRTTWTDLTAIQRDCLEIVFRRENGGQPCDERQILRALERRSLIADRTRLYADLMVLVGRGLLSRRVRPAERTTEYRLADEGRALLLQRAERLAEICGIRTVETETATETAAREKRKKE